MTGAHSSFGNGQITLPKQTGPTFPSVGGGEQENSSPSSHVKPHETISNTTPGLERGWFPVAFAAEVSDSPISIWLLGEPWVVVRLGDEIFAAHDQCPHRLAPLSAGTVVDETLQCGYHGWRFDQQGACVRIPSMPEGSAIPNRAKVRTPFAVIEHLGIVWIAPAEPLAEQPDIREWNDPSFDRIHAEPRRTSASAAQLMDNFVDVSHFATLHASTFGVPGKTELEPVEVVDGPWSATTRFTTWYLNHDDPLVATGEHELAQPHVVEKTAYAPFHVCMRLSFPMTDQLFSILYAMQPESESSTRIYKVMVRNDFDGDPELIADMLEFEDRVLDEDLAMLEAFRSPLLHLNPRVEVHTRADRLSLAYRRLLDDLVNGTGRNTPNEL